MIKLDKNGVMFCLVWIIEWIAYNIRTNKNNHQTKNNTIFTSPQKLLEYLKDLSLFRVNIFPC
jgi:hypothetical protein